MPRQSAGVETSSEPPGLFLIEAVPDVGERRQKLPFPVPATTLSADFGGALARKLCRRASEGLMLTAIQTLSQELGPARKALRSLVP